jgi:hypothetical protein
VCADSVVPSKLTRAMSCGIRWNADTLTITNADNFAPTGS